jgi:hypothetical protein
MKGEGAVEAGSGLGTGGAGERRAVMACMLWLVSGSRWVNRCDHVPVKGPGERKVVVARELAHARVELAIIDQAAGLVDDEERKHNPASCQCIPSVHQNVPYMVTSGVICAGK